VRANKGEYSCPSSNLHQILDKTLYLKNAYHFFFIIIINDDIALYHIPLTLRLHQKTQCGKFLNWINISWIYSTHNFLKDNPRTPSAYIYNFGWLYVILVTNNICFCFSQKWLGHCSLSHYQHKNIRYILYTVSELSLIRQLKMG
jgi:hypothetical protein